MNRVEQQLEIEELRARLAEAEDALAAIREGRVDAVIVDGVAGPQVFSLAGAETIYRRVVETMGEAALNVSPAGTILFCNERFCEFVATPMQELLGRDLIRFVAPEDREAFRALLSQCGAQRVKQRLTFCGPGDARTPALLIGNALTHGDGVSLCFVAADLTELEDSARQIEQLRQTQLELRESRREALSMMEDAQAARREAEQTLAALRESEERLRLALDGGEMGVWEWDPAAHQATLDARTLALFGLTAETFDGTADALAAVTLPEDLPGLQQKLAAALKGEAPYAHEFRVRHAGGAVRWIYSLGRPQFDASGKPVRFTGVIFDITERKQRELNAAFLADLQAEFGQLSAPEEIARVAAERIAAWFNLTHCLLVEIDEAADTATVFHDARAAGAPNLEGAYRLADFHTAAERSALAAGQCVVINNVRDGTRPEAAAAGFEALGIRALLTAPYASQGRWRFALSAQRQTPHVWRDDERALLAELAERIYLRLERARAVVELRASEEAFRVISNAAPAFVWVCDQNGENIYFNDRWSEYTGQSAEEARGFGWAETLHPDDAARILPYWERCRATGETYAGEARYRRHDGEYRWHAFRALPRRNAAAHIEAWYGLSVDIHERKEAEEALREADRRKDEFLAVVSHELRTPLNAVLGYARLIRTAPHDAAQVARFAEVVERSARAQQRLIEDLLDTARMISGKLRLEVAPTDLRLVLEDALAAVRPAADARQVNLAARFDDAALAVTGDAARLQQIVWNLLQNAVKFTPAGGQVMLAAGRDARHVRLTVSDTGAGIAADFLPYVFDRFAQNDMSRTRRHGGLGLGLALVKQLVELHGGQIEAVSAGTGRGATFTVTLPLAAPQDAAATPPRAVAEVSTGEGALPLADLPSLAGVRVLAVDDQEEARGLIAAALASRGAKVMAVASGLEALALLADPPPGAQPDVLLLDIAMPEEDGYSVLRRVRALEAARGVPAAARLPAVALTACASSEDRLAALTAGFQMHVAKPVEMAELIVVINSLVINSLGGARPSGAHT